ncbi:hypothetical protein EYR38_002022 [Pleurotus pulmonarius]|nr:hypothetical protein EYR38_002013 [Pleurotus pulmonarius]KAF4584791.1 hypothetical protein EYR38_002022 [Pleurotus pulmonarius]
MPLSALSLSPDQARGLATALTEYAQSSAAVPATASTQPPPSLTQTTTLGAALTAPAASLAPSAVPNHVPGPPLPAPQYHIPPPGTPSPWYTVTRRRAIGELFTKGSIP